MNKEPQLSLENDLFHEEREELKLLECLGQTFRLLIYLKSKIEATGGNYDYKSKQHVKLASAATSLSFMLYWMGMLQSLTTKQLAKSSNYEAKDIDYYLEQLPAKGYQVDLITTPHSLYEQYLRGYSALERCIKTNQKTIDRITKGNELVICMLDSMQDTGKFLEEIM